MTDSAQWFYAAGTEQKGPFSVEQINTLLAAGVLLPETLVWTAGMAAWAPLAQTPLAPRPADPNVAPPLPLEKDSALGSILDEILFSVKGCFQKYATFDGRSGRSEYWYFTFFNVIASLSLAFLGYLAVGRGGSAISYLYSLVVFLPSLAVLVRRLHDTNRSGWLALLLLVPLVGGIVLIVFCCLPGTKGRNQYG